ncbi:MAG: MaoC/PaaZ C-terminal domain-containing protein [Salinirussus sp.]
MEIKRYFDDFQIGDSQTSDGRTLSEADIHRAAGYEYGGRVHVDREYMQDTEWGDLLVQNTVLITISSGLWNELSGWEYEASVAYGRDNMRFVTGAHPGDTVHLEAEVTDKRIRQKDLDRGRDRGIITVTEELLNQDGDLVMINDHHSMLPWTDDFDPEASPIEIE